VRLMLSCHCKIYVVIFLINYKMEMFYILPAEIYVSKTPVYIQTLIGSCVSICLWSPFSKIGGMNHYLLPYSECDDGDSNRYGNTSISNLINKLMELGAKKSEFQAKIFGGANVLKINEKKVNFFNIGEKNIEMAFKILNREKIKIVNYDVGGQEARRILFNTGNFQIRLKKPLHKGSF